ncbi:MAG TPA: Arc family DNA-binding protein [Pseudolabrys sp.]|nr:Arc family DNA-binding protein [Pseudolabrys sp.]
MAKKDLELRPVMTRIPEGLRRRLEREAKWHRRSMNAEIIHRLQESFDLPDHAAAIADDINSELSSGFSDVDSSLDEIQSQNRAILSHLGLPDPAEDRQRVQEDTRARIAAQRRNAQERRAAMERTGAAATPPAETEDGEKK